MKDFDENRDKTLVRLTKVKKVVVTMQRYVFGFQICVRHRIEMRVEKSRGFA